MKDHMPSQPPAGGGEESTDETQPPISVLHVDDDPDFGDLVKTFLSRNDDLEVSTVTSAATALERLEEGTVDCVVSDYEMPTMDGLEFLAAVRVRDTDLPFILFTGKGSEEIASEAISAGVTDYLRKGIGTERYAILANRIRNGVSEYRANRALAEREERFRKLTETAPNAILTLDSASTIVYANPAVEDVFGYAPGEVIDEPIQMLMPEEYRDRHQEAVERYLETGERQTDWHERKFHAPHKAGHEIEISISFFEFEEDGERRLTGVIRDITAEQRREREFQAVFEGAFDAMVIADDAGEYVEVNPAACDLFGLPEAELLGRTIREFAPPDYDFEAAWREFMATEAQRGVFPLVRADGEQLTVEFAASSDVVPGRHLSILREIPER